MRIVDNNLLRVETLYQQPTVAVLGHSLMVVLRVTCLQRASCTPIKVLVIEIKVPATGNH